MSFKRYLEEQKNTHMEHAEDNDVLGWQSPKQVLEIISRFESMA